MVKEGHARKKGDGRGEYEDAIPFPVHDVVLCRLQIYVQRWWRGTQPRASNARSLKEYRGGFGLGQSIEGPSRANRCRRRAFPPRAEIELQVCVPEKDPPRPLQVFSGLYVLHMVRLPRRSLGSRGQRLWICWFAPVLRLFVMSMDRRAVSRKAPYFLVESRGAAPTMDRWMISCTRQSVRIVVTCAILILCHSGASNRSSSKRNICGYGPFPYPLCQTCPSNLGQSRSLSLYTVRNNQLTVRRHKWFPPHFLRDNLCPLNNGLFF